MPRLHSVELRMDLAGRKRRRDLPPKCHTGKVGLHSNQDGISGTNWNALWQTVDGRDSPSRSVRYSPVLELLEEQIPESVKLPITVRLDMITYFNLHRPESERLLADDSEGSRCIEKLPCPISHEHVDGLRRVSDLALEVKHDSRDEKIVWRWIEGCVVHESLVAEFRKGGLTGYRLRPSTVRFRDGGISKDYQELIITGWAGIARPESGIRVTKRCPRCQWKKYSSLRDVERLIDWSQWSGGDFFIVWPLPGFILITERVAELLLSLDIKSFQLRGLQEIGSFGFTVARLSDFMPEDLAIKYGRPLGLE
jgi:hypothetical protein